MQVRHQKFSQKPQPENRSHKFHTPQKVNCELKMIFFTKMVAILYKCYEVSNSVTNFWDTNALDKFNQELQNFLKFQKQILSQNAQIEFR